MSSNIVKKHDDKVYVYDLLKEKVDLLASRGAVPCKSAREVAKEADIIITMLPRSQMCIRDRFISPVTAVAVAVCTGIGFFFSTTPVIALRALSHVVFAFIGAVILKKKPELLSSPVQTLVFGFVLGVIHGICEVIVVTWFYFGNSMSEAYYTTGFFKSVILLVGVGTVIHSLVDFILAVIVWKPVSKVIHFPVSARA